MTTDDDPSERTTQPNGIAQDAEQRAYAFELRNAFLEEKVQRTCAALTAMTTERDHWRERFMIQRSRLHGIADSLRKVENEIGRIIDEK